MLLLLVVVGGGFVGVVLVAVGVAVRMLVVAFGFTVLVGCG